MKIPESFTLLGHPFTVHVIPPIQWKLKDCVGLYQPAEHRIFIRAGKQSLREHTFFHELTHAILDAMGKHALYEDEEFVDAFAGMLHQIMKTAKYPKPHKGR